MNALATTIAPLFGLFQGTWGIAEVLIAIVCICGGIGIVIIACRVFEIKPPPWLIQMIVIVLVVIVACWAIRFIFSQ